MFVANREYVLTSLIGIFCSSKNTLTTIYQAVVGVNAFNQYVPGEAGILVGDGEITNDFLVGIYRELEKITLIFLQRIK